MRFKRIRSNIGAKIALLYVVIGCLAAFVADPVLAQTSKAQRLLSPREFGDSYRAKLATRYPKIQIHRLGALGFKIGQPPDFSMHTNLDNAYQEYRQNPSALEKLLDGYVAMVDEFTRDTNGDHTRARMVPTVRSAAYLKALRSKLSEMNRSAAAKAANNRQEVIADPIAPGLVVIYAFDLPLSLQFATTADLRKLKLARKDVAALARTNLRRLLEGQVKVHQTNRGAYALTTGSVLGASLLLLPDQWKQNRLPVKGDFLVYVPSRDAVVVTGTAESEGRRVAARISQQLFTTLPRPLFDKPLVRRNGRWQIYE